MLPLPWSFFLIIYVRRYWPFTLPSQSAITIMVWFLLTAVIDIHTPWACVISHQVFSLLLGLDSGCIVAPMKLLMNSSDDGCVSPSNSALGCEHGGVSKLNV